MRPPILLLVGLAIFGRGAEAHHSIAAMYDIRQQVTVEGVVSRFAFINPHPFITLEVKNGGQMQSWRLELDNRFELADIGVTAETFQPGDRIVVSGSPGRAQALSLYVRKLDRPADGFQYEQVGFSPRIGASKEPLINLYTLATASHFVQGEARRPQCTQCTQGRSNTALHEMDPVPINEMDSSFYGLRL